MPAKDRAAVNHECFLVGYGRSVAENPDRWLRRDNFGRAFLHPMPVYLEIARTATSEELPGTAFSTVVESRAWKYAGTVLWSDERAIKALRSSAIRSGFVRYSIAA